MNQTFVTFQVEDQPGQLGRVAETLSKAGVNILAYNSFQGNATILPDNVESAMKALKAENINCSKTELLAIDLPNTKGQLARLSQDLGKAGVNIESSFAAATPNTTTGTIYVLVDDIKKAQPVVEKLGGAQAVASGR